jgi:hypothetical protein
MENFVFYDTLVRCGHYEIILYENLAYFMVIGHVIFSQFSTEEKI